MPVSIEHRPTRRSTASKQRRCVFSFFWGRGLLTRSSSGPTLGGAKAHVGQLAQEVSVLELAQQALSQAIVLHTAQRHVQAPLHACLDVHQAPLDRVLRRRSLQDDGVGGMGQRWIW